jgi:hypothetical protein
MWANMLSGHGLLMRFLAAKYSKRYPGSFQVEGNDKAGALTWI